jgi:hypothetical protein
MFFQVQVFAYQLQHFTNNHGDVDRALKNKYVTPMFAFSILFSTLYKDSKKDKGKLYFPRNRPKSNPEFKRAQFTLNDFK